MVLIGFLRGDRLPGFDTIGHEDAHELLSEVHAEAVTPGNVVPDLNEFVHAPLLNWIHYS